MTEDEFLKPLVLGRHSFAPGNRATIQLPVGRLITHEMVDLTIHVRRGTKPGPRLLVTAAVHGDEINGVEVIRRLMKLSMRKLAGDLLLIPIVNLPAFLARSRYLPDRRDLNRLFPGSASGSFGARLASILTNDVSKRCTHGIDLHTGAVNRPNLPQIRFSADVSGAVDMAKAFGAPVMITSSVRSGSFRNLFSRHQKPQLMFEGGEAGNLEPASVRIAVQGVLSVMRHLGMLAPLAHTGTRVAPVICRETRWERAPRGGLFLPSAQLGKIATRGMVLGEIGDPFGTETTPVLATEEGVIIGRARNAVIDEGDGIVHIGLTKQLDSVVENIEVAEAKLDHRLDHPVFDEMFED
jgi:predicted deacylase